MNVRPRENEDRHGTGDPCHHDHECHQDGRLRLKNAETFEVSFAALAATRRAVSC
jgi:hypothetical protein